MVKIFNLNVTKTLRQNLRNNMSVPEKILWKFIKSNQLGYKFRRQHGMGKYVTDFYCPALRLDVEVDGQIHGEDAVEMKDARRDIFFRSMGLVVKRYTANEINNNLEWVLTDLKKYCDEMASAPQEKATPPSLPLERGGSQL